MRESQVQRLQKLRADREESKVKAALSAITEAARAGTGKFAGKSGGSSARFAPRWVKSPTRWRRCLAAQGSHPRHLPACTAASSASGPEIVKVREMADEFEQREGRRPHHSL